MILALSIFVALQVPAQDAGARYVAPLVACFAAQGWTVEFRPIESPYADVYVMANQDTQAVLINARLDSAQRVAALAYQMAYNHGPEGLGQRDRDLWSELVSYRVLLRLDLPTDDSVAYLRRFDRVELFAGAQRDSIDAESASIHACAVVVTPARAQ